MPDRRPIASRNSKIAGQIARMLSVRGVSPNLISQASMVFAALAGTSFALTAITDGGWQVACLIAAALGCQMRLLCNLFDGMVAVEGGHGQPDGPFWNEAPDRVSDTVIFVGLGIGAGLPALGWAAAALAIGTAYLRELGSAQGLAADFCGPMAKPQRMAVITGAALLDIAAGGLWDLSILPVTLWAVAGGTAITVVRRSYNMIAALQAR
ncbi:CDP-alcohol phosphatidyltransferase family protein [Shimia sp. R11_0]|uniref:CDP-alcohol phosphatidyltransferase family protein n=1 Tax=Shimia sp. R11_0 TaxID=2821096 RepID=UPI001ADBE7B5|nr:CDP-alcohol phosphatidyltransferase family protein [Shimia sp. R11_0]MBO9476048.1 CDP-alcohol phosphatidyltransferase family protein [Shimia sp. R11_0]